VIVTKVNKAKVCDRLDLSVPLRIDFIFLNWKIAWKIADKTVAAITQDRPEETDLECFAQIDNAEALCGVTSARITEPARRLSKPQRVPARNNCDAEDRERSF